jgi:thiamine biosynthesis lipoprotein
VRPETLCLTAALAGAWLAQPGTPARALVRHEASRMSMACLYTIAAYGHPDTLPAILDQAFDEVDRIDRLMSHYRTDSPVSRLNRDAARGPVAVEGELFAFIAEALRYQNDSGGAFDITVGPLMRAWGFFRDDGRVPSDGERAAARRRVGAGRIRLDPAASTVHFDADGVEIDLGGIAKGYAVDRAAQVLRQRGVVAALISAGGSSTYGLGTPPGQEGWYVALEDPIVRQRTATSVRLRDRALSVAGRTEKFFEAGGVTYSHIMDPRTGWPAQGVLSVAVLAATATAGDALDNALFVLGVDGSRDYLRRLPGTDAFFFVPSGNRAWTLVQRRGGDS